MSTLKEDILHICAFQLITRTDEGESANKADDDTHPRITDDQCKSEAIAR